MNEQEFRERLPSLLAHWSSIEASIKRAELLHSLVPVSAINELRYAGRQLIRAFSIVNEPAESEGLARACNNAEQYLVNADHDVTDAMVVFISRRITDLNIRFGKKAIEERNPDYHRLVELVDKCRTDIEKSRGSLGERTAIYKDLSSNEIPQILSLFGALKDSDAIMKTEIAIFQNKIIRAELATTHYKLLFYISALSSFIAIAVAVLVKTGRL